MTILLGSGGFRTPDRVAVWAEQVRAALPGVRRVLFVPHALADHEGYLRGIIDRGLNAGYFLNGLHRSPDPVATVREAEAIFVGGGNTFRLLAALYQLNLIEPIRERVRAGMPYLGISAGTNVACPTIRTTNDMPIVQPPSLDALGLVPFQVNPHYYSGANYVRRGEEFVEHFGEARDDRLREFHEENEAPVVGLWEGGVLRVAGGRVELIGASARVFHRGRPPEDVESGTDLGPLLVHGPATAA
jgi:dipeptidase E